MTFPTSYCSCGRSKRRTTDQCGFCRKLARGRRDAHYVPACRKCGREIYASSVESGGVCSKCRGAARLVGGNAPTPPHIDAQIEVYADRVARRKAGERDVPPLFSGYERDLLVERGIRDVA